MNFGDLINQVTQDLFVWGEQENLIPPHRRSFIKAMVDLQTAVECYRFGNTDTYPQCSTYFDCGLTVLPAPRGRIERIYTIGKIQSTTGVTNGAAIGSVSPVAPLLTISGNQILTLPTSGTVCAITADGTYTVTVAQVMTSPTLYPFNAPQYFRTEINYTDTNGNPQSVQPADLIHLNTANNTGTSIISVKGGTSVTFKITPFNTPQVDGKMTATISVIAGATGADDEDWCRKVEYHQVDYCHIERYVRACRNCNGTVFQVANAISLATFGCCRQKYRYKQPTDVGFEQLPPLPQGFHYPQASTDAGYRSDHGVFAIHRGRIYIAPWIESTESLVVEWNGIKTNWAPTDLVEDDPKFMEAVKLFVGIDHYTFYESDVTRTADLKKKLYGEAGIVGVIQDLIIDCRERNRVEPCLGTGTKGSAAVGIGGINGGSSATFTNTAQSFTANCPSGQSGNPVTVNIAAGSVSSTISVDDANATALAQAQSQANAALQCSSSGVFLNVAQTFTANCAPSNGNTPAATGAPVTVTIPAGTYQSTVSQANADAAALQAATLQATSQLVCTFHNAPQTATATCPTGTTGSTQSDTVQAGQFSSTISQADADAQALAAAQNAATILLVCTGPAQVTVANTIQIYTLTGSTNVPGCSFPWNYNITGTCPVNTYTQLATTLTQAAAQAFVNQQALAYAASQAQALYSTAYQAKLRSCITPTGGAGGGGGSSPPGGRIPI